MRLFMYTCTILVAVLTLLPTLIGSAPAARKGDYQSCPMWCSPYEPHIGGNIIGGLNSVRICGEPAARVTDFAVCQCGTPPQIVTGSPTVMIGGLPAARMNDITNHGGKIEYGCTTVLIGP